MHLKDKTARSCPMRASSLQSVSVELIMRFQQPQTPKVSGMIRRSRAHKVTCGQQHARCRGATPSCHCSGRATIPVMIISVEQTLVSKPSALSLYSPETFANRNIGNYLPAEIKIRWPSRPRVHEPNTCSTQPSALPEEPHGTAAAQLSHKPGY